MSKVLVDRELLPCPFCGQQEAFVEQLDSDASVVICQGMVDEHSACLARGPVGVQQSELEDQPGKDAAIAAWNDRAQPAEAEGVKVVAWLNTATEAVTVHPVQVMDWDDESEPVEPLVRQSDHLAALSAVTTERDALAARLGEWERSTLARIVRENVELTAERDRLATENERLARDAKNDAIAYKAVIERQEELRSELDAIRAQRGEPVAEIVKCEPYEDGSTNPHNTVNWFGLNAENDLPAGTKLYATP